MFDIDTIRHSTAHAMAQAISRLWPSEKPQFGVGPVIENGFYYDVDMSHKLTNEDLKIIEKQMKKIIKEKLPIIKKVMDKGQSIKFFKKTGQGLKVQLIESFPQDEIISCYSQGEFTDLCRGPHVENTNQLSLNFKLLNVTGAYWLGNEKNKMLQRIYAVCFESKEKLKQHLEFLELAKKRDHRKLGVELELFLFDKHAPGSPFFLPKGTILYNLLVEFIRKIYIQFNYKEVITPQLLNEQLWHTSGHYQNYKENMYFSNVDNKVYAVKPMNCPAHMLMFKNFKHSYRDLPLRYADFGRLHRYEKAGAVGGLTRVRSFCQDDAHIFIQLDKIEDEILKLLEMFFICYKHFNFSDIKINLATRPDKKVGDDQTWDKAEKALALALDKSGHPYTINPKDGAFYGPKIDIKISDALKRYHQLGTIQLDFQLPDRFDLKFTNSKGEDERPVVIHRALLGSIERFLGVYIEHTGGAFPFWLAPVQLTIIPVSLSHINYVNEIYFKLRELSIRVFLDDRNQSLGYKTRQTQKGKIPFMAVIGDNEVKNNTISIRAYGEKDSKEISITELIKMCLELDNQKNPVLKKGI